MLLLFPVGVIARRARGAKFQSWLTSFPTGAGFNIGSPEFLCRREDRYAIVFGAGVMQAIAEIEPMTFRAIAVRRRKR